MPDEPDNLIKAVDQATLTRIVRRARNNSTVQVTDWQHERLHGGFGGSVNRISGHVRGLEGEIPWSVILKIPRGDAGEREPMIYRSGFLDNLPGGLKAPRCFEVSDRPDGGHWIWMEYVKGDEGIRWPANWICHLIGA